ncbi:substrate-binding domain-containing protein [Microbacterium rhizosphaerae]
MARVSTGTVSNVLNRPALVALQTRERVERAILAPGFVPNRAARTLVTGLTATVGFVVEDLENSFFLDIARGAQTYGEAVGTRLLLANSDNTAVTQRGYLRLLGTEHVSGMLVAPVRGTLDDLRQFRAPGRCVVVVNHDAGGDFCNVTTDNERGGYLAARHLLERGRRRLAFAGGEGIAPVVHDRLRGVVRAVREANGASTLEILPSADVEVEDGRRLGVAIAARPPEARPDGIVGAADLLAMGLVQALETEGVGVPAEIAITGYDDNRAAWNSRVPLTTVDQMGEVVGEHAVRLLLSEIDEGVGHIHRHVVIEPALIPAGQHRALASGAPRPSG